MIPIARFLQNPTIYLPDRVQSSLAYQWEQINFIAALAFRCLVAIYVMAKSYFNAAMIHLFAKDQTLEKISPFKEDPPPLSEQTDLPSVPSSSPPSTSHPQLEIDPTSTLIFHQNTGKYVYMAPAPPIKNLVISGGGAKGVVLPGVIKAFEEHKVGGLSFKEQLDHVAGSSIGAVTAAFIAIGLPVKDLIAATTKEDFKALLGKGYGPLFKDGKPLVNFIRTLIQNTLTHHLLDMFNVEQLEDIIDLDTLVTNQLAARDITYSDEEVDELTSQMETIVEILKNKDINRVHITFSMLQALRKLNPNIFKDLTVTATCRENGQTYYFDAEKTPQLDIAVACRASASLPLILNPVKIKPKFLLPRYEHANAPSFVDGGYFDNIPVGAVEKKQGENNKKNVGEHGQNLQTLVLIFDGTGRKQHEQSPFHDEVIRSPTIDTSNVASRLFRDHIPKFVVGINTQVRHTVTKENGMQVVRMKYTQRNIPLLVSITTIDFDKAKKEQHVLITNGYEQAKEYLTNHHRELIYRTFNSLEELLEYMPEEHVEEHWDRIAAFAEECSES